jgi:hypothetical protein
VPYDAVGAELSMLDVRSHVYDLKGDLGYPVQVVDDEYVWYGLKPDPHSHVPPGYAKWEGFLSHVKSFVTDWNFKSGTLPPDITENSVSHYNLYGTCVSGIGPETLHYVTDSQGLYIEPAYPLKQFKLVHGSEEGDVVLQQLAQPFYPHYPRGDLLKRLPALEIAVESGAFDTTYFGSTVRFTDFRSVVHEDRVQSVSYVIHYLNPNVYWPQIYYWVTCVRVDFSFGRIPFTPVIDVVYDLGLYTAEFKATWNTELLEESVHSTPWEPDWTVAYLPAMSGVWSNEMMGSPTEIVGCSHFRHTNTSLSGLTELVGYDPFIGVYQGYDQSFLDFTRYVNTVRQDCYPSNFLSSKAAVDAAFASLETNFLETVSEYKALFSVVDVLKLIRVGKTLGRFRGVSLVLGLLSLLTDAALTYSFGIAPTISDATKVSRRASRLMNMLYTSRYFGTQIIRGGYEMEFPEHLAGDFAGVKLYSRSKILARVPEDSVLPYIMPVRSLGLLPSLSSIWDLIPLSWAVDYAFGIGQGLETLDTQLLFLLFDVRWSLNSIEISWNFPETLQEELGFSVSSEGPHGLTAGYKYFDRYVYSGMPVIAPTRLPMFWGGPSDLNWTVITSYLYKLVHR